MWLVRIGGFGNDEFVLESEQRRTNISEASINAAKSSGQGGKGSVLLRRRKNSQKFAPVRQSACFAHKSGLMQTLFAHVARPFLLRSDERSEAHAEGCAIYNHRRFFGVVWLWVPYWTSKKHSKYFKIDYLGSVILSKTVPCLRPTTICWQIVAVVFSFPLGRFWNGLFSGQVASLMPTVIFTLRTFGWNRNENKEFLDLMKEAPGGQYVATCNIWNTCLFDVSVLSRFTTTSGLTFTNKFMFFYYSCPLVSQHWHTVCCKWAKRPLCSNAGMLGKKFTSLNPNHFFFKSALPSYLPDASAFDGLGGSLPLACLGVCVGTVCVSLTPHQPSKKKNVAPKEYKQTSTNAHPMVSSSLCGHRHVVLLYSPVTRVIDLHFFVYHTMQCASASILRDLDVLDVGLQLCISVSVLRNMNISSLNITRPWLPWPTKSNELCETRNTAAAVLSVTDFSRCLYVGVLSKETDTWCF